MIKTAYTMCCDAKGCRNQITIVAESADDACKMACEEYAWDQSMDGQYHRCPDCPGATSGG